MHPKGEDISIVTKRKKASSGWSDLCMTFGESGLSVPPIPKDHRDRLVAQGEWFWSTRADINSFAMYRFFYAKEILTGPVDEYSAVSHSGHGVNSYSINVSIVKGPVAVLFQDSWGGVYSRPVMEFARLAACFAEMRLLFKSALKNCDDKGVAHLVTWSGFRNVAEYWAKNEIGNWAMADARPPMVRFDADERRAIDIEPESVEASCRRFLGYMTVPESPSEVRDTPESI
jgi:hypothetical protein